MDELDDSSSIIRNQVGDMVGMVELDKNDEDIEKVDIDKVKKKILKNFRKLFDATIIH